ncbi:MAG: hypothetical protein AAGC55_19080, partial [Myxococcota bacterium]
MSFLPSNERIPGVRQRHRLQRQSGLQVSRRVLLIGARSTEAGDEYDFEARRVRGRADSKAMYGAGSMLDLMVRAALMSGDIARFDRDPGGTPELYALAIPPAMGAEAAQILTFTGQATNTGSVVIAANDHFVRVGVPQGATAADIAAAAALALARIAPDLAYTVEADNADVLFSAREPGTWGEQLFIHADTSEIAGIDASVTRFTTGAGELDLGEALATSMASDWDCVVLPESSATTRPAAKAHVADAWDYTNERYRLVVLGHTGALDEAIAQAGELDDWRIVLAHSEQTPGAGGTPWDRKRSARMHSFELAAAVGARLYSQERANHNYNHAALAQVARPATVARPALNDAIGAGVTVVIQGERGESAVILDPVTTYQTNAEGAPDTTYQPVEVVK